MHKCVPSQTAAPMLRRPESASGPDMPCCGALKLSRLRIELCGAAGVDIRGAELAGPLFTPTEESLRAGLFVRPSTECSWRRSFTWPGSSPPAVVNGAAGAIIAALLITGLYVGQDLLIPLALA